MKHFARHPGFDRVAAVYPFLERLVYARRLEAGRCACLPALGQCRSLLLLGEGNGRFLRDLLKYNPQASATVVEISPRMLDYAKKSLAPCLRTRVRWVTASVLDVPLPAEAFDAVVTHYLFDLFAPAQQAQILQNILPALKQGGLWQDTEFLGSGQSTLTTLRNRTLLALAYRFLGLLCDFPARTLHCPSPLFREHKLALKSESTHFSLAAARLWQK